MFPDINLPDVVYIHEVSALEPWNTVIGAVVGGLLSLLITVVFYIIARRQAAKDREEARKLAIYRVYIKLMKLLNHGFSMRQMYSSFLDADHLSLDSFHRMPAALFYTPSFDPWKTEDLVHMKL